ncbi:hypothetical protein IU451_30310 [Nocardia cyriacigeorgica]|jgi:hypothetical protein|uniref:hypothetical protein n=1 Tax=Nocardia cyriacigeorgica TaxID=135487 RepID=UPI0018946114|nr:hypothetical protein [Nocardia cyriacigeorgica]MBF6289295.1 hypothetical protein [Nocardia cyriacigeorgica]MBF6326793.1 hypothetical protein [Nocardia cyriacigeorgica]
MTSDEMFLRPAICRYCGAHVADAEQHKAFHDGIAKAFEQLGKTLERFAKPRGGVPKRRPTRDDLPSPPPPPRPPAPGQGPK